MSSLRPSRYTLTVPLRRGRMLAYNGMSGALAVWEAEDRATWEQVQAGEPVDPASARAQELQFGGFIIDASVDELGELERLYRTHRYNPGVTILTITPTLACNFGCDYCFQGQDKPKQTMGQEVQDAIVAYVEDALRHTQHIHIAWYGGEPLLRPKVIESLSDRFMTLCQQHGAKYDAMIVTNGYRLNLETARMLEARNVKTVQVTLDGDAGYHDSRRHLLSGGGTYGRIIDNLKEVVENTTLSISVRVNIDKRNAEQITAMIDNLAEAGLAHRPNFKLYFAPIEAMTAGCHSMEDFSISKREYGLIEADLYRYGHEKGLTVLPYPPRFHGTCAAVRPNSFVITPTGDVHKCWDTVTFSKFAVGSIFDPDGMAGNAASKVWDKWTPFNNSSCRNCRILPNCAGACAYKFVHADETRGEAAALPCPSWKYNVNERLLLRAERQGAITAEDYDPAEVQTDPSALCTDVHVPGGMELPASMKRHLAATAK